MSRTRKHNDKYQKDDDPERGRGRQRRLSARGVRREDPDLGRMGKALIAFALADAEAQAERRRTGSRGKDADADRSDAEEQPV